MLYVWGFLWCIILGGDKYGYRAPTRQTFLQEKVQDALHDSLSHFVVADAVYGEAHDDAFPGEVHATPAEKPSGE